MKNVLVDVVIIGAGLSGLMIAKKLTEIGLQVVLLERKSVVGSEASTKNHGWLHSGAYHSASHDDKNKAIEIARTCKYGFEQILSYAPEVVENPNMKTFALIQDKIGATIAEERWLDSKIEYSHISHSTFAKNFSKFLLPNSTQIFQVDDVGIDTTLLCRKLLWHCNQIGVEILFETQILEITGKKIIAKYHNQLCQIDASSVIYAAGAGIKDFLLRFSNVQVRVWESSLLIVPQVVNCNFFFTHANSINLINHLGKSIVGISRDTRQEIGQSQIDKTTANMRVLGKLAKVINMELDIPHISYACKKVDLTVNEFKTEHDLGISIFEPEEGHFLVVPGKMTAIPYMTDEIVRRIHRYIKSDFIGIRPLDQF